jgi:hypothetical protein
MKKLFILFVGGLLLISTSCNNQHEVVPPPLKQADLECSCNATIDGAVYEYSDTCTYDNEKTINTSSASKGIYTAKVLDAQLSQGVEVSLRTLEWLDDGSNNPTIEEWKSFFETNTNPNYYVDDALSPNGVVVKWTDPNGVVWHSDTTLVCGGIDFIFTEFTHDSDQTGNYMKFKAIFNCPLLKADLSDTICLENGVIKTSFKRE